MKTRHKVLIVLAAVVGLLGAAAIVTLVILSIDEPPPDVADLEVHRLDVADEENVYWYFTRMSNVLDMPEETGESSEEEGEEAEPPTGRALVDAIREGEAWDAAFVEDLWQRNQEAVRLLEQGLACSTIQAPQMRFDSEIPEVFAWIDVARLLDLHAMLLFKQDEEAEAFEEAIRLVRFGHAIESSKGGLVLYLVGKMVKGTGIERLRAMLPGMALEPQLLVEYAALLGKLEDSETALADTFRAEHESCVSMFEDFLAGRISSDGSGEQMEHGMPPIELLRKAGITAGIYLKPNQTRRFFAETFRVAIENIPRPYVEMQEIKRPWSKKQGVVLNLLLGNIGGRILCGILLPAVSSVIEERVQAKTQLAATRALLAMKAFKVEKGRLPETLDELVPEYLEAVPLDDFDGKPLRYNPEKKVVYSVGEDLVDGGGMTKEEQKAWWLKENPWLEEHPEEEEYNKPDIWQMPDPSFPIEF